MVFIECTEHDDIGIEYVAINESDIPEEDEIAADEESVSIVNEMENPSQELSTPVDVQMKWNSVFHRFLDYKM